MGDPWQGFDERLRDWFEESVGQPTAVQRQAWPAIASGEHVLLTAPTGTGKTLAASCWALNQLLTGVWEPGCLRVLYLSPMKALGSDVRRNLSGPLAALLERFALPAERIRIATRSGDTDSRERARMARRPPEILVTTPESLNLMLASKQWAGHFDGLRQVIIDEVHAVAGDKRGCWMMNAVEQLSERAGEIQRIALSATVRPLEGVGAFVAGAVIEADGVRRARRLRIVDTGERRVPELQIAAVAGEPGDEPPVDRDSFWLDLAPTIRERVRSHRSTLIFTNSRQLSEKLTRFVNQDQPERLAFPHHGSLSRELRQSVEAKLKDGELPAVVATASLELGIDIGDCEQVLLVQTPPDVASMLQRLGRAGHRVDAVSRGALYPTHAHDLLEGLVLARQARAGQVEPLTMPRAPLDLLLQMIVQRCLIAPCSRERLFASIRRQHVYRDLGRTAFDLVCELACGRVGGAQLRELKPFLIDEDGELRATDRARPVFTANAGTIPDRGYFTLRVKDGGPQLGQLDEEFVWERKVGDHFTLGSRHWRITRIGNDAVEVLPSERSGVMAPFWKADQRDRSWATAAAIAEELADIDCSAAGLQRWRQRLVENEGFAPQAAEQLAEHLQRQAEATRGLPHRHRLVIERSREVGGQELLLIHACWGRRLLRPLAMAIEALWQQRFGTRCSCLTADDCCCLQVPHLVSESEVRALLEPQAVLAAIRDGLEGSGFFGARFRENAGRALLLPKTHSRGRTPLWLTRQRAKDLLARVRRLGDHPLVAETWRSCLEDHFQLGELQARLEEVADGRIALDMVQTERPSPFARQLVWQRIDKLMYDDDQPVDVSSTSLDGRVLAAVLRGEAALPRIEPAIREALHGRLSRTAAGYAPQGIDDCRLFIAEQVFLDAAEWAALQAAIRRDADAADDWLPTLDDQLVREAGRVAAPVVHERARQPDAEAFLDWLAGRAGVVADACWFDDIAPLIEQGRIVRGALIEGDERLWLMDAAVYQRALAWQRRARQPALPTRPITALPAWLARWQGLLDEQPAMQRCLEPMLGCALPAALWERAVLPCRLPAYRPSDLDDLVGEGPLAWFGVGPRRVGFCFHEALGLHRGDGPVPAWFGAGGDLPQLQERSGWSSADCIAALWTAVWDGGIANQSMKVLRQGIANDFRATAVAGLPQRGRASFGSWQADRPMQGRWYALPPPIIGDAADPLHAHDGERERARQLVARYGIVFRELLRHEHCSWQAVLPALRLLELAGELVSGIFFDGLQGLQFASSEAVQRWREHAVDDACWLVHSQDPAAATGLGIDGLDLPPRHRSCWLVYQGQALACVATRNGSELRFADDADHHACLAQLRLLVQRAVDPLAKLLVETVDGRSAKDCDLDQAFLAAGFESHPKGWVLRRAYS